MKKEDKKAYFSRIGKLGAAALNNDPEKKSAASLKGHQTRRLNRLSQQNTILVEQYAKLQIEQEKRTR